MEFAPGGWSPPDTVTYITDFLQTKNPLPTEADFAENAEETEGVCFVDYQKIWSEIRSATADENGLVKIPPQQVQRGEVLVIASSSVAPAALATPEVRTDYGSFKFWSLAEQPRLQLPIAEWEDASRDLPHATDPSALAVLICYASETMYKKRSDWRELDDCWMRMRNVPRRSFFVPSMTTDGPLPEQLAGTRITHVCHVRDQSVRTFSDSSLSTANLAVLPRSWAGFSKFPKQRVQTEKTVRFAEPLAEQGPPPQPARPEPPQAAQAEAPPLPSSDAGPSSSSSPADGLINGETNARRTSSSRSGANGFMAITAVAPPRPEARLLPACGELTRICSFLADTCCASRTGKIETDDLKVSSGSAHRREHGHAAGEGHAGRSPAAVVTIEARGGEDDHRVQAPGVRHMKARGNRMGAWWTRAMCHGRWERFSKEDAPVLPPESSMSDFKKAHYSRHAPPAPGSDTILTFGKHRGSTIRFVGTTYPKYCQWLLKTAKEQPEATTEVKQAALALSVMGIRLEEEEEASAHAPSEHLLSSGAASDVTGLLSSEESDTDMMEEEIREAARRAAVRDPARTH